MNVCVCVCVCVCVYIYNIGICSIHVPRVSPPDPVMLLIIGHITNQEACQYLFFLVSQFATLSGPYTYTEHLVFKTPYFIYGFPYDVRPSLTPT